ncbi:MAG: FxLYD domain-containing protein [Candidatus Sumerlaeota bacterium]
MKRTMLKILLCGTLALAIVFASSCAGYQHLALKDDIKLADQRFEERRYVVARAQYMRILNTYPQTPERERILYRIGRTLYNDQIQLLVEAREAYELYLDEYPQGEYAEEARSSLRRIEAVQANRTAEARSRMARVAGDVVKLQEAIQNDPYNADLFISMGNALWKLGLYDDALEAYLHAQEINAAVKEYDLMKKRVMVDADGEAVPLTPGLQSKLDREDNPLVVFNTHSYNSRSIEADGRRTPKEIYFNVQGLVRNQSSRTLENVVVEVRFMNAAGRQVDVQRQRIGTMPPGAVRAFGVQASRYDNIYNISNYRCFAYER